MSTQIAVRIPERDLERLDRAVSSGRYESRADALRHALSELLAAAREREIEAEYRRAYGAIPQEGGVGEASAAAAAMAIAEQEGADDSDQPR